MADILESQRWTRRRYVAASVAMAGAAPLARAASRQAVPFSQGDEPPTLAAPEKACDCHMHV